MIAVLQNRSSCPSGRHCLWSVLVAVLAVCPLGVSAKAQTSEPQTVPAAPPAVTSPPTVTAKASATAVPIAEPFWLELTVTAPPESRVTFPLTSQSLGPFDVVATQQTADVPPEPPATQRTWTRRMQLESLLAGPLQIPELEIRVLVPGEAEPHVLRTQAIDVRVASVLEDRADPRQFRDIESVVDVPIADSPPAHWPWWTAGTIAVVAFAAGVLLFRRRRTITPAQWALQQIDQLHGEFRSGTIDSDSALKRLSETLQDYLRSESSAVEPATPLPARIDASERDGEIDSATAAEIRDAWAMADKAKFAGWQLSDQQLHNVIEQTRRWLQTQAERV